MAEARLEQTEHGLVPQGEGWFVLNARDAPWIDRKGRGVYCEFCARARSGRCGRGTSFTARPARSM
jgi:hypothetical protein